MPRLKDGGSLVSFEATNRALVSAGPNRDQAQAHLVAGGFETPSATLKLASPRGEPAVAIVAAEHVRSGNPPRPEIKYQIEYSTDDGASWRPIVADWSVARRGREPSDFWSQGLCWGAAEVAAAGVTSILVRFRNDGGRPIARCEAHLVYRTTGTDATEVTFAWDDDSGPHRASHPFSGAAPPPWEVATGRDVRTRWVEMRPRPAPARAD